MRRAASYQGGPSYFEQAMPKDDFLKKGAHVKAVSKAGEEAADAPYGWVEGIANAFEVDRSGDLVLPTAIAGAMPKFMTNPVLTFGHGLEGNPSNGTLPAGTVIKMWQDPDGNTNFRARFASTDDAQKARKLYQDGDMRAFSIHYLPYGPSIEKRLPTDEEMREHPGVESVITKCELIEIALAVVPVNAGSLTTGVKSFTGKGLKPMPKLKRGAKAMGNTILTSDHRKAIEGATKAYEAHVKSMESVQGALDELSEGKDGAEADHGAMSEKCMKAFTAADGTHKALGEAIKAAHKSITNASDDAEEGEPAGEDAADEGSPKLPEGPEAKSVRLAYQKAFA